MSDLDLGHDVRASRVTNDGASIGEGSLGLEYMAGADRSPHESASGSLETLTRIAGRTGRRLPLWLQSGAPAWTWVGMTIVAAGFVLIAIAWGSAAGETQVYRQLPYVVSAGLLGLGVIMVGLTFVNIASGQRDAMDRDRQVDQLVTILGELRECLLDQRHPERPQ